MKYGAKRDAGLSSVSSTASISSLRKYRPARMNPTPTATMNASTIQMAASGPDSKSTDLRSNVPVTAKKATTKNASPASASTTPNYPAGDPHYKILERHVVVRDPLIHRFRHRRLAGGARRHRNRSATPA